MLGVVFIFYLNSISHIFLVEMLGIFKDITYPQETAGYLAFANLINHDKWF